MIVSFNQAKILANIGYPQDTLHQYKYSDAGSVLELGSSERMYNRGEEWNAPECHDVLEWFRKEKSIPCAVSMDVSGNLGQEDYFGRWRYKRHQFITTTDRTEYFKEYNDAVMETIDKISQVLLNEIN